MTVLSLIERRVWDHIGRDEFGIEYGRLGQSRLQTTYRPIFSTGKGGQLRLAGLRAGYRGAGDRDAVRDLAAVTAAPLAIRNFGHSGVEDLDLYLDRSIAGTWTAKDLAACGHDASIVGVLLPNPRRIFIEIGASGRESPFPVEGPFRRALVNDQPDDQLDAWISRLRPSVVRFEGSWLASLADHAATRTLLATLAAMLTRRGVKTLFEGLGDESLVSFALECGADFVEGDALAQELVAGERISGFIRDSQSSKVIPVDFARGRKPTGV